MMIQKIKELTRASVRLSVLYNPLHIAEIYIAWDERVDSEM